jgi:hypothetical protein
VLEANNQYGNICVRALDCHPVSTWVCSMLSVEQKSGVSLFMITFRRLNSLLYPQRMKVDRSICHRHNRCQAFLKRYYCEFSQSPTMNLRNSSLFLPLERFERESFGYGVKSMWCDRKWWHPEYLFFLYYPFFYNSFTELGPTSWVELGFTVNQFFTLVLCSTKDTLVYDIYKFDTVRFSFTIL